MPKHTAGQGRDKSGGGDPNILKLSDTTRIRIVDPGATGIWFKQHAVEDQNDGDQVRFVVCPGPQSCPLCRKPVRMAKNPDKPGEAPKEVRNWPISRRFAYNVWDYDSESVKVLMIGPSVEDEFEANKNLGYDPTEWDFRIHKTGSGIQTKYKVVRGENSPLPQAIGPDDLHDLNKYDTPESVERIFEIIEEAGFDYDAIAIPTYTEEEALAFVMPFGKGKGFTVEQLLSSDPDWLEWLHDAKLSDGNVGDPVFIAIQTAMEARGMVPPLDDYQADTYDAADRVRDDAASGEVDRTPDPEPDPDTVTLVSPGGDEVVVPEATVDGLLAAGFTRVPDPEPEVEPQADAPTDIDDATEVTVEIAGATVKMAFAGAVAALEAGTPIEFADKAVELAAQERLHPPEADEPDEPQGDPDKPFACECGKAYKTKGALTQHVNKQHPDKPFVCDRCGKLYKAQSGLTGHVNKVHADEAQDAPEPEAAAAPTNGGTEDREVVLERVKTLLADTQFSDYNVLLNLFDEVAGKRNITDFSGDELLALEQKLKSMD